MAMIRLSRLHSVLPSLAVAALLAGCSADVGTIVSGGAVTSPYTPPAGNFQGTPFSARVMAGNTAIAGATVQVYAAGTTGNGSAPVQLLPSALTTDSNGAFSVSSYTCPYNTSVLFVTASGGHMGSAANNPTILLMSSPGACGSMTGTPALVVNEATTVASAYAFAQFLKAGGSLGATSTNATGLTLAAATAANLVNPRHRHLAGHVVSVDGHGARRADEHPGQRTPRLRGFPRLDQLRLHGSVQRGDGQRHGTGEHARRRAEHRSPPRLERGQCVCAGRRVDRLFAFARRGSQ